MDNYSSKIIDDLINDISISEYNKIEKKMLIAAKISDTIYKNKLSVVEFSKIVNKDINTIEYWLSGTYNFNIDEISIIEDILKIKLLNI